MNENHANNTCNGSQGAAAPPMSGRCQLKVAPQQLDRIRKQEDEEQWISGEELCTEGSSDDDGDQAQELGEQLFKTSKGGGATASYNKSKLKFTKRRHSDKRYRTPAPRPLHPSPLLQDSTDKLLQTSTSSTSSTCSTLGAGAGAGAGDTEWRGAHDQLKLLRNNMMNGQMNMDAHDLEFLIAQMQHVDGEIQEHDVQQMREFRARVEKCKQIKNSLSGAAPLLTKKNARLLSTLWRRDIDRYDKMKGVGATTTEAPHQGQSIAPGSTRKQTKPRSTKLNRKHYLLKKTPSTFSVVVHRERRRAPVLRCDRDRKRLNDLLSRLDEEDDGADRNVFRCNNKDLKESLDRINEQLKTASSASPAVPEPSDLFRSMFDDRTRCKVDAGVTKTPSVRQQLKTIDHKLKRYRKKYLTSVVVPLSDEQMSALIRGCMRSRSIGETTNNMNDERCADADADTDTLVSVDLSADVCKTLLNDAKKEIPKYKYKYSNNNNNNNNDDDVDNESPNKNVNNTTKYEKDQMNSECKKSGTEHTTTITTTSVDHWQDSVQGSASESESEPDFDSDVYSDVSTPRYCSQR